MAIPKKLATALGKDIKRADAMLVTYESLHVEPDFNIRERDAEYHDELTRLAQFICDGGFTSLPPLEIRPRDDGGAWIVDGHRRHTAIAMAEAQGAVLRDTRGQLWVPVRMFEGNDLDRTLRLMTSNEGAKLRPVEVAVGYKRLLGFGLSQAEIGRRLGVSPTHVANILTLANAPESVQTLVRDGKVSTRAAVQAVREQGDGAADVLGKAVAGAGGKQVKSRPAAGVWRRTGDGGWPDPHTRVLVAKQNECEPFIAKYSADEGWVDDCGDVADLDNTDHWMDLPGLPTWASN